MTVQATPRATGEARYETYDEFEGLGWMVFAGVLLLILGTVNFVEGIAAIGNAHFFVANTRYVIGDLNTWGWVVLCVGTVQALAGLGVFLKNQIARWVGVAALALNAIAQLLMMPAYPFWSLCLFAVGVLALYGLIAHGRRLD